MMISFKISNVCSEVITRQSGKNLRELIIRTIESGESVLVDLENKAITPSFADDAFGKLVSHIGMVRFKKTITIKNVDAPSRVLIAHVVNRRAKEFMVNTALQEEMTTI